VFQEKVTAGRQRIDVNEGHTLDAAGVHAIFPFANARGRFLVSPRGTSYCCWRRFALSSLALLGRPPIATLVPHLKAHDHAAVVILAPVEHEVLLGLEQLQVSTAPAQHLLSTATRLGSVQYACSSTDDLKQIESRTVRAPSGSSESVPTRFAQRRPAARTNS
jgi:hypothetical protein